MFHGDVLSERSHIFPFSLHGIRRHGSTVQDTLRSERTLFMCKMSVCMGSLMCIVETVIFALLAFRSHHHVLFIGCLSLYWSGLTCESLFVE